MIAGIVLVALGVKKTLVHVDEPLDTVPAVALFGGIALYYAGHVGFRLRNLGTINRARLTAPGRLARADPARGRGRRAGRPRARGGAHLRRDRLRGDPLQRGAPPHPPRARRDVSVHQFVTRAGTLLTNLAVWQARSPSWSVERPTTRSSTGCSRRPAATSSSRRAAEPADARLAGRPREARRARGPRARERRGHPRHLPPPALAPDASPFERSDVLALASGPRRRGRLRRGGLGLPRALPRRRADGPGDRPDRHARRRRPRGGGRARLRSATCARPPPTWSRSSGSRTRATACCARASPRSSRAGSTRWS